MIHPPGKNDKGCFQIAYCLPVLRTESEGDTSFLLQALIAQRLSSRGHQIRFVAPLNQEDVVCSTDLEQKTVVPRSWSATFWFRFARKGAWKLQQVFGIPYLNYFSNSSFNDAYLKCLPGVDLVQERNGIYRMAVAQACKQLKLPYIMFFDGDDILEQHYLGLKMEKLLRLRAEQMIRFNLAAADRVICVSETAKARLTKIWQVPDQKITVFINGVDINLYRPDAENAPADRASLGYSNEPVIVLVSSFYPWQDVRLLLESFVQVLREEPRAKLLMVGNGKQYDATVQYANDLGIQNSVRFTGFLKQEEVSRMVNAADIAVAPYINMDPAHFINSPMKLFEYMAAGKAVVATGIGQIKEVIEDGQTGFCVPPGDSCAFAETLIRLIRDPGLRERIGSQARVEAVQKYSWDDYILRLEALYATVIEERRKKNPIS